jgi:NADPH:quinone reductase-like Zn-dependent oxidoreductase
VKYLRDHFGLPEERIFHSRDTSFQGEVLRATDGRGVDLVLNSLSGDLLHASWQCVAKYGKMVELGKRDIMGRGLLTLSQFAENRAFHGVDLAPFIRERPDLVLRYVMAMTLCLAKVPEYT